MQDLGTNRYCPDTSQSNTDKDRFNPTIYYYNSLS